MGAGLIVWSLAFLAHHGSFSAGVLESAGALDPGEAGGLLRESRLLLAQFGAVVAGATVDCWREARRIQTT